MRARMLLISTLLLTGSTLMAQQVSVNYSHSHNFSQYHTYAWGSNNANQIQNSILAQVAQTDVNSTLHVKGLTMVQENQGPDLILTASGGLKQETIWSAWGMMCKFCLCKFKTMSMIGSVNCLIITRSRAHSLRLSEQILPS